MKINPMTGSRRSFLRKAFASVAVGASGTLTARASLLSESDNPDAAETLQKKNVTRLG